MQSRSSGTPSNANINYQAHIAQVAEQLQPVVSRYLQEGAETLLHETADLARRRPALFCVGAALAGFAAVRLLKASAHPPADASRDHDVPAARDLSAATDAPLAHPPASVPAAALAQQPAPEATMQTQEDL